MGGYYLLNFQFNKNKKTGIQKLVDNGETLVEAVG